MSGWEDVATHEDMRGLRFELVKWIIVAIVVWACVIVGALCVL